MTNGNTTWCRICGHESAVWRPSKRQSLCKSCNADTPRKARRSEFDRRYWGAELESVPIGTRREFYADYLASSSTLPDYIERTTSCAGGVS